MSAIILTGLSRGKHKFNLEHVVVDGVTYCFVECKCGFQSEIIYFRNYAGVKEVQRVWELHTSK